LIDLIERDGNDERTWITRLRYIVLWMNLNLVNSTSRIRSTLITQSGFESGQEIQTNRLIPSAFTGRIR